MIIKSQTVVSCKEIGLIKAKEKPIRQKDHLMVALLQKKFDTNVTRNIFYHRCFLYEISLFIKHIQTK